MNKVKAIAGQPVCTNHSSFDDCGLDASHQSGISSTDQVQYVQHQCHQKKIWDLKKRVSLGTADDALSRVMVKLGVAS